MISASEKWLKNELKIITRGQRSLVKLVKKVLEENEIIRNDASVVQSQCRDLREKNEALRTWIAVQEKKGNYDTAD